jgi:Cof subfamily protein (haloacid dehalogenase superfamily)
MRHWEHIWLDFSGCDVPERLEGLEKALAAWRVLNLDVSRSEEQPSFVQTWFAEHGKDVVLPVKSAEELPNDALMIVFGDGEEDRHCPYVRISSGIDESAVAVYPNVWELRAMFSVCAVFSDIDGTILHMDHTPSERTVHAIESLEEQGIPFVLVSARPPHGIRPISAKLRANHLPIVAYAGALVLDGNDEVLMEVGFSSERAQEIAARCKQIAPDTSVSIYHGMDWLTDTPEHEGILFERSVTGLTPKQVSLDDLSAYPIVHKILCIGPAASIDRLDAAFQGEADMNCGKSKATFLELTPKTASKSAALRFFCEHQNLPVSHTMAFGDYYNDLDMLQAAGCGIAMANAPDDVKQAADVVTTSNDDDGVARILEQKWLF